MKSQEDFPLVMKPQHVAQAMGISRRMAYDVMEMERFPLLRVRKSKMVSREAFFKWLSESGEVK